jgi:hypothetical protein
MIQIRRNEADNTLRRIFFQCFDATDGMTPEEGEANGQPEISYPTAETFSSSGIGVLVHMGSGRYYAELDQATVDIPVFSVIESRYKSANTTETFGTSVQIMSNFDSDAAILDISGSMATEATLLSLSANMYSGRYY